MTQQNHLQAVSGESWSASDPPPGTSGPGDAEHRPTGGDGGTPPSGSAASTRSLQRSRAERPLPTDRLSFEKQIDVLRAIARLSGRERRAVTAEQLSEAMGMKGNTAGLSNRFFVESNLVEFIGRGSYTASGALLDYHRHLSVDPQDLVGAVRCLVPAIQQSWYWQVIEPMLDGGLPERMALLSLSGAAGATEHTAQLQIVLQFLVWLRMLRRDGDTLLAGEHFGSPLPTGPDEQGGEPVVSQEVSARGQGQASEPLHVTSSPLASPEPVAMVSFNFSVRITADDAARLTDDQLQTLLSFAEKLRG